MGNSARPSRRSAKSIAKQWDNVAAIRDKQIRQGLDLSYNRILVPTVVRLAQTANWNRVIDIGCGTGVLTEVLGAMAKSIVAIDPSSTSIAIAKESPCRPENAQYLRLSAEEYASDFEGRSFTLAIANMVLQDTPRLQETLKAVAAITAQGATLVCTITHPWFWPLYWGYADSTWFHYDREIAIEAPFRISADRNPVGLTTHYHRPISRYVEALYGSGFVIDAISEPMPDRKLQRVYPERWKFPRFLALKCRRLNPSGVRYGSRRPAPSERSS